jgi:hypothetical protein
VEFNGKVRLSGAVTRQATAPRQPIILASPPHFSFLFLETLLSRSPALKITIKDWRLSFLAINPKLYGNPVRTPPLRDKMSNDFQTLVEFLDRCGPEVTGNSLSTPHTEDAAKLLRFAAGKCDDRERAEICNQLRLHPAWLRWLADRVKMARNITQRGTEEAAA